MFNFLNGVYLAATLLTNIMLYSDENYAFPVDRESAVAVSLHREFWRDDGNGKCKYTGLMVPYVRDWEEVVKHGEVETILPPEPNKTAGHAFIVNQKVCGTTVEPVFRTGVVMRANGGFLHKHSFAGFDVTEMKVEDRPKWLEQVLRRVDRVAATDANAAAFVQFNKAAHFEKMPSDLVGLLQTFGPSQTPTQAAR